MKNVIYLLLIGFSLTACKSTKLKSDFEIVGKWKSDDNTGVGYFTFDKDSYAVIETAERTIGGKIFVQNGMEFSLKYKVDYNFDPIRMDLIFTSLKGGNQMVWPCIFKITTKIKYYLRGELIMDKDQRNLLDQIM